MIAVLFLFLRNVRASLLTASVIPLSLLVAFLAMKRFGVTANLMRLGALDFGLLVDAAVVMVENFVRRLTGAQCVADARRDTARVSVRGGPADRIRRAIIVAVYIPIFSPARARRQDVPPDGLHGLRGRDRHRWCSR